MARPRVASKILDIRGALRKHPEVARARAGEPVNLEPIGDAPEKFDDASRASWDYLKKCAPAGVITEADAPAFEILSVLFAQFRERPRDIEAPKLTRLETLLGRFGMTPSDRSKVTVAIKQPKSEWDSLETM